MDPSRANELLEVAERLSADAEALRDELDLEFRASQLAAVVDEDYDLGEVVGVDQIFGGYVNLSFAVRTRDRGRRAALLRAQVQPGHHRARDPLRARARQPHQRQGLSPRRARVPEQGRRHVRRARRGARRRARDTLLRRVRDARGPRPVHLGEEPLHRRRVRRRGARPRPVPPRGARLRARRAGPRAAAHHGSSCATSNGRSRLRRAGEPGHIVDDYYLG